MRPPGTTGDEAVAETRATGMVGLATALGEADGGEDVPYAHDAGPGGGPLRRWFVRHRRDDLLDLLRAAGFEVLEATERTTHRHWLLLRARAV